MKVKQIVYEDFTNYKKSAMFIGTAYCDGKCYKELNKDSSMCINHELADAKIVEIDIERLIEVYLGNTYSDSVIFGGLEPMLQINDIITFLDSLRNKHNCDDDVVIYTGYYKEEITKEMEQLQQFSNVIVKFGRFIPDKNNRYDDVLGVTLASDNQYAEKIS